MNIIVTIVAVVGAAIVVASPFVMLHVSRRPANGEKHELENLDRQIATTESHIAKHFKNGLFHVAHFNQHNKGQQL